MYPAALTTAPDVHAVQSETFIQTLEDSFRLVRLDERVNTAVVDYLWKCAI